MRSSLIYILVSSMTGMLWGCGVDDSDPGEMLETTSQPLLENAFGYAKSNELTGTSTPDSTYAFNTGGGPITIEHMYTGIYHVTFGGLGGPGGNAQVVALGTDNTRCKVHSWFQSGSDEIVRVHCHDYDWWSNSRFVVRYVRTSGRLPRAYLWADQPSAESYTPMLTHNFNSTGVANTITRSGKGTYTVNLPGLGGENGSVLVTATESTDLGPTSSSTIHCNVLSWGSAPGGTRPIEVRCWAKGVLVDSEFSLAFDGAGVTGFNDRGAFAWAHDPTSASYSPSRSYSFNSSHFTCQTESNSAGRWSTGRYFMRHEAMPTAKTTVHVTARAYPAAPDYCKVEQWGPFINGAEVRIRCFDASGAPKDAEYAESYYTGWEQTNC